ncbi:glycosyltransferase [Sanguibacter suaedae]|uniref:Glycosyltransferase family 2 protein n=1 Tax=Sanguibacter suaedae TaxID=2795737 RepID=A0A934MDG9_9MICO|nr:glycosyltransferase [Sanguibacter suaedae]MBI9114794.1 glycosyltransferase family 2 protein [Sanguibacter suaedae]
MTSPDQAPPAHTPPEQARTGSVTAVVVTRGTTPYVAHTLDALHASTMQPARVVVVDVSASDDQGFDLEVADGTTVVRAPGARTFGAAVSAAVSDASVTTPWLWLLHDDSAPEREALHHLLRALEHTSNVALAGAKQVRWEDPDELIEVGFTTSRSGRRMTGVEPGELDQGQHDGREDVLAVGLAGALARTEVWVALDGPDPTYGLFGDGLDLSRRARLAGHRVIVVPDAVVLHAQGSLTGVRDVLGSEHDDASTADEDRSVPVGGGRSTLARSDRTFGARLRSQLYYLATTVSGWVLPFFLVASVVAGPPRALYRIAVKQPGQALDEIWAPLWLLVRVGRVLGARRRIARTSVAPRSLLTPLTASTRDVLGQLRDRRLAHSARRRASAGSRELDAAEIRRAATRRRFALAGVVALSVAATVVALGPLLSTVADGRIVGGALLLASGGAGDVWDAVTSGWVRDGLGASAPADPLLTALLPLTVLVGSDLQLAVNLVVVTSLVLSGVGAWFASGAATRSVPVRFWVSTVWVAAPPLLLAVGEGRLGAVLAHAALPWFALATARAVGVQRTDTWGALRMRSQERAEARRRERLQHRALQRAREGRSLPGAEVPVGRVRLREPERRTSSSIAALGAAGLVFAVVVQGAPVLLVPGVVALAIVAVAVPRDGKRLLLVPLPALAVFGPVLVRAVATWQSGGWRILLGDPGLPLGSDGTDAWRQLLLVPVDPAPSFATDGAWSTVWSVTPYLLGAVVLVAAVVGLARSGGRGVGARTAWCVVPLGLGAALASSATAVAVGDGSTVSGWPGSGLSLMLLALLVAGALGVDGLSDKALRHTFGWRQVAIGLLAVLVGAVPVLGLAAWGTASRTGAGLEILALDGPVVPAVGQQMQTSARQARVLVLETRDDGALTYQLLHDDGPQLTDSSVVVNVATLGGRPDDVADLVADLAAGADGDQAERLADLGVGAVLVPSSDALERARLVGRIDTVAGVQRITESDTGTIWRVAPPGETAVPAAWARTYVPGPGGALTATGVVDAQDTSVRTTVPDGDPDRVLVLAETAAPGWTAELDGVPLRSVESDGRQAFALGPDGGDLTVGYERASRTPWFVLQGIVLTVSVLLALPVRRRPPGGVR